MSTDLRAKGRGMRIADGLLGVQTAAIGGAMARICNDAECPGYAAAHPAEIVNTFSGPQRSASASVHQRQAQQARSPSGLRGQKARKAEVWPSR